MSSVCTGDESQASSSSESEVLRLLVEAREESTDDVEWTALGDMGGKQVMMSRSNCWSSSFQPNLILGDAGFDLSSFFDFNVEIL